MAPADLVASDLGSRAPAAVVEDHGRDGPPSPPEGGPGGGDGRGPGPAAWWRPARLIPVVLHAATYVPLLSLVAIVAALAYKAAPAIVYNGFGFFGRSTWDMGNLYAPLTTSAGVSHPPGALYGVVPLVVGTLASSAIAIVLAVPVALGTAIIVVEKLPARLSAWFGFFLELLAGVPSVVIGLWGVLTLGPFLSHDVAKLWADHLPDVPVLSFFRGPTYNGEGLFTAGVVLAMMIVPIIAATTRDLLRQVPRDLADGAAALGLTDAESMRQVVFPWVRPGVIGATLLGLGRALGETIAVAMVSGALLGANARSLYSEMTTIAATIVTQLDSALTDASGLATSTLAEVGLILLVITLLANVGARLLVRRVATTALPVGRGI